MSDHPFSEFLRILGKGPRTRRSLDSEEARRAMQMILDGIVTDKQLGAFLLLMRANGESQAELLGFLEQIESRLQDDVVESGQPDLDWATYSGKWRYPPYFLLALKLLAQNGYKVLLHGDSGQFIQRAYAEQWLEMLEFCYFSHSKPKLNWIQNQVHYLPMAELMPEVRDILHLKSELGVRTVFNTLVKLLNPLQSAAAVQGIYHKGVEKLHHAGASVNQSKCNLVFKGEGGEAEIRPDALIKLYFSLPNHSQPIELKIPAVIERQTRPQTWRPEDLLKMWQGEKEDLYGAQSVICTAAVGLMTMQLAGSDNPVERIQQSDFFQQAYQTASHLWEQRS
jgi:anthranilate phosphoribosyltransferase